MLKSWLCSLVLLLGVAGAWSDEAVPPGELGADDVHAVRAVVEGQIQALSANDADGAFQYTAPEIRQQFGDAGTFTAMVQRAYPMLINPTSVSFFRPELVDGSVIQAVQFHDHTGHSWRAVYELQRQPDSHWRIAACLIAADNDEMTT